MKPIDLFLSRLEKVRRNGRGYLACCPAHDDKTPSMTVKETESGSVVFHCFAGCAPEDIVSSIDLTFSDLYPDTVSYSPKPTADMVENERLILEIARKMKQEGKPIKGNDLSRLELAVHRIKSVEGV